MPSTHPTAMPTEPPAICFCVRIRRRGGEGRRAYIHFIQPYTHKATTYTHTTNYVRTAVARVIHISVWDLVSRASGTPILTAICVMMGPSSAVFVVGWLKEQWG